MTKPPIVLDAAGLEALATSPSPERFRALLERAVRREQEILVPTIVCAELARGRARTRRLEAALGRHVARAGQRPPVRLVDTDFALARQVGALLHAADLGSAHVVDAHVVALCIPAGGGLVVTADPDDIDRLAATVPAARIRTAVI